MLRSGVVLRASPCPFKSQQGFERAVATIIDLLAKRGWVDLT
jgi:hypothetical protein